MLRLLEHGVKELRGRRSDITGDRAAGAPQCCPLKVLDICSHT